MASTTDTIKKQKDTPVNRIQKSPLVTIDLSKKLPRFEVAVFDLQQCLYKGLILKEKDFRQFVREHDWSQYDGKHVAVHCSTDAIVPTWAYMLVSTELQPYAGKIVFGDEKALYAVLIQEVMNEMDQTTFEDGKFVIKGCGDKVPEAAYVAFVQVLIEAGAASVMYGEPCSTVPLYKKKRLRTSK